MDIAIHLGAHCTDEDLIVKTLSRNGDMLRTYGVAVPPQGRARPAIRKALQTRRGNVMPGAGDPLIADILGEDTSVSRMVLSYEAFLGIYAKVLAGNTIYAEAGQRAAMLRDLFPGHNVQFFLAMRNPATFVPAIFEASSSDDFSAFVSGHNLANIAWSQPIEALRSSCPEVPLTIWCNEDLPMIWPDLLRVVSGVDVRMKGENAVLQQIMTPSGFKRLEVYLKDNPAPSMEVWRKVVTAFLGKYADDMKVEPEINLPGWSEDMIAGLSDLYERDVEGLKTRADLTFIQP